MNGSQEVAQDFAEALSARLKRAAVPRKIILCPPFPYLSSFLKPTSEGLFEGGGQDCSPYLSGAYTGDVSASMLFDVGCRFVLVGHSERRQHAHEMNDMVRKKSEAALYAGLKPIICVGETLAQRQAHADLEIVETQLRACVPMSSDVIIAYEPVWAIGTGLIPSLLQIQDMHQHMRAVLASHLLGGEAIPLLYGGSVTPQNAASILTVPHVDGVLVGGASLRVDDFDSIISALPSS